MVSKSHKPTNTDNAKNSQKLPATPGPVLQCKPKLQLRNSLGSLKGWMAGREGNINNNNKNNDNHNGPQAMAADRDVTSSEKNTMGDTYGIWEVRPGHESMYLID